MLSTAENGSRVCLASCSDLRRWHCSSSGPNLQEKAPATFAVLGCSTWTRRNSNGTWVLLIMVGAATLLHGHRLTRVFHEHTKAKAGRKKKRLLILDGHGSHVNLDFVNLADKHRIAIAVLPPHSTHRLRPLDVGIFSAGQGVFKTAR